jgi:CheY-like chemotaxis protein
MQRNPWPERCLQQAGVSPLPVEKSMATVLVVDDEFGVGELLKAIIEGEGHEVQTAPDGEAGLAMMLARPPDLIFTDTMMPRMDGPALVAAMTDHTALARLPVGVMSAIGETTVGGEYRPYDAFLRKPFRMSEVITLLARLLPDR